MLNLFIGVLCFSILLCISSKPYQVPLQGKVGGQRTLVLLDDTLQRYKYSIFFESLSARGHQLSFISTSSPSLSLLKYGEYLYDNILLFAPSADDFSIISFDDILDFVNFGGNLLVATDSEISDNMRQFAASCGVEFDKKNTEVIDHFSYEPSVDKRMLHTTILSKKFVPSEAILGEYIASAKPAPVLYRGIGHVVDDDNVLAVKILQGNPTTYSSNLGKPIDDHPENAGADTLLVTALQARNNARVVFSGSIDMFSNEFFLTTLSSGGLAGNELFCSELSKWVFGEAGVLRFRDVTHSKSDGTPPDIILHEKDRPDLPQTLFPDPEITRNSLVYRIKDDIVYSMIVELYEDGQWKPFSADDMQMEFVMLDPYVRKTMTSDPNTGKFVAAFTAPDDYGVFKFRVLYRRVGYSVLHAETTVSIRPFKHNEYERFIPSAYPYYTSAFSVMTGFFVFSLFFLFSD
mmetsp:Transcript_32652/g.33298  ORF Transcript_32652/g.33298 Transcript_32652/m.33298 type:complete len:462 (-) Transcript_32652:143-1528(-)